MKESEAHGRRRDGENVVMLLAAKGPDRRNISPKSDAIGDADVCC
jgi:hypothetical protein